MKLKKSDIKSFWKKPLILKLYLHRRRVAFAIGQNARVTVVKNFSVILYYRSNLQDQSKEPDEYNFGVVDIFTGDSDLIPASVDEPLMSRIRGWDCIHKTSFFLSYEWAQ